MNISYQWRRNGSSRATAQVQAPATSAMEAAAVDPDAGTEVDLALIWRELALGVTQVVDVYFTERRHGLVLSPCVGAPQPLVGRRRQIVESLLCGCCQKRIAIELGISPSTVALHARAGLEGLGSRGRPSRVHPLLMLAASAAQGHDVRRSATLSYLGDGSQALRVLGVPRQDRRLCGTLPEAELEVVRCLFEGKTYAQMARARGTSVRTIANQIAAVFRRLNVSGRGELLQRLFALEASRRPVPTNPAPARLELTGSSHRYEPSFPYSLS